MSLGIYDFRRAFAQGMTDDAPLTKDFILSALEDLTTNVNGQATPQEIAQILIIVFCDLMLMPGVVATAEDESSDWQGAFLDAYASITRWVVKSLLVALKRQSDFNTRFLMLADLDRLLPKVDPQGVHSLFNVEAGDTPAVIAKRIMEKLPWYFRRIDRFAHAGAVLFADMTIAVFEGDAIPLTTMTLLDTEYTDLRSYRPRRYSGIEFNVAGQGAIIKMAGASCLASVPKKGEQPPPKATLPSVERPEKTVLQAIPAPASTPSETNKELLERVKALEDQLSDARKEIAEARSQGAQADQDRMLKLLKGRIRVLQGALSRAEQGPPKQIEYPKSFDDLSRFAAEHLGDRVIISRRAQRAAANSNFRNVQLAYRVLKMLVDDYLPMRDGEEGAKERFDATCQVLKVSVGPTGMALLSHRTSETYRINHMGKRYPLDLHVQGNSSFDPRDGFRLYFHVIEDEGEERSIVVGHFPEHLPNSLT